MKTSSFRLVLIVSLAACLRTHAQQEYDADRITDELFGFQDQEINYAELYENVMQLLSHPINLNKASEEELRFLNLLSPSQIKNFLDYRRENQNLLSIYELQAIPEFDLQTIHKLVPFVKVLDPATRLDNAYWRKIRREREGYFLLRYGRNLQPSMGTSSQATPANRFNGSADKYYIRYRTSRSGDYSVGFTAEKDAGEAIRWSPSNRYYGIDYLSFHIQIQNKGILKNLVVGDFQCQYGQGLVLGSNLGMGKGSETITTVRRSSIGIVPYTSVYEAGFLRGLATTLQPVKNLELTVFFSHVRKDASSITDTLSASTISAFQTSGLHRNENELTNRKKNLEQNWGGVLEYKAKQIDVGILFNQIGFDRPVVPVQTRYNQFAFRGTTNRNIGLFLSGSIQNLAYFAEFGHTIAHGSGIVTGILWSMTDRLDVSFLYRKFAPDFHSWNSNAFSENSAAQNETGIYWGWKYRITQHLNLSGYLDMFKFPWLRYRAYAPTDGHEGLLRITYQPNKNAQLYVQVREESKERNIADPQMSLYQTTWVTRRNYWVHMDYGLRKNLRFKTRAQFSTVNIGGRTTTGMALVQDLRVELGKIKLTGRYALFDTQDYDNRQYVYENDVYLAYAMPAYYDVGVRKLIMIEYKINRSLSIWLRYAHMRYAHLDAIGSGVDAIDGDRKSDIKLQLQVRF